MSLLCFDESESVSAVSDSLHSELWLSWDGTAQRLGPNRMMGIINSGTKPPPLESGYEGSEVH